MPYPDGNGGGFWMIRTAAEADWPQQSRLIQIFDNHDGTLSIFGTILDHASNATAPSSVSNPATPDPSQLASIGRTLAYNDTQVGARQCTPNPCGEGAIKDRNVELILKSPLPEDQGAGKASALALKKGPCANRKRGTRKRDRLRGTKKGDRLLGRGGRDKAQGLRGRDCLKGQRGRDKLMGGPGADRISGGRGADKLVGGRGRDRLKGGRGEDRLFSRGGGSDNVRCGKGRHDRAVIDRHDRVGGCETVVRRRRG
jgi:Ca2+-binding RTX toxin-like protein